MNASKISQSYCRRLDELTVSQYSRAIVTIKPTLPARSMRGLSTVKRQAVLEAENKRAREVLLEIDAILAQHGGHRLSENPGEFGTLVIEATAKAIFALAELQAVSSIMEDQLVTNLDLK